MTTPQTAALFDAADDLERVKDASKQDADAAAHQLARYVAEEITAHGAKTPAPTLVQLVSIYDASWVAYLQARDRWQLAAQRAMDAHKRVVQAAGGRRSTRRGRGT